MTYLTIDQVCKTFEISKVTEKKYRQQGKIIPAIVKGKTVLYTKDLFPVTLEQTQ